MVNAPGQDTLAPKKKRGPPPTGVGTSLNVRLQPDQLASLDGWIARQSDELSRPEAVRKLLAVALGSDSPKRSIDPVVILATRAGGASILP